MLRITILLVFALLLRFFGINWDNGSHFHPDERMLLMVVDRLKLWSNLNPNFFNYGSFPIYILRIVSEIFGLATYDKMLIVGRFLSIGFELITALTIYKITLHLFGKKKVGYLALFLYSIMFFPIQNAHFFVVDVPLTTFTTVFIYRLLLYVKYPTLKEMLLIGFITGLGIATKFTAVIFSPFTLLIMFFIHHKNKSYVLHATCYVLFLLLTFLMAMPYALINFTTYLKDIGQQLKMNSDPYIFPYTLQYVGTLPYWYYLKNILLWGAGPIISFFIIIGLKELVRKYKIYFVFLLFYFFYFLIIGRSSVKFMRYMLPLYPFFAVSAAFGIYHLTLHFSQMKKRIAVIIICFLAFFYSLFFLNIYAKTHTRLAATDWILAYLPKDSTLAIEHWDDRLPVVGQNKYKFEELTLYDLPDNEYKWSILNEKLRKSDYLILASNRLYVPLQNLADCKKFKKCYPKTADYYKKLFAGKEIAPGLRFHKIKEFTSYPMLAILGNTFTLPDDSADESFTVYDHPKILIFKKD